MRQPAIKKNATTCYCYVLCSLLMLMAPAFSVSQVGGAPESSNQSDETALRFTPEAGVSLSPEEWEWLAQHRVLRHGIVDNHRPFEYVDEAGVYRGLTSDYIKIIAEQLGIRFETVAVQKFETLSKGLSTGALDIASYLPAQRNLAGFRSDPLIQMPIVMFGREDAALVVGLDALDNERVVVERPSRAQELLQRDYPNMQLIYVDTPAEGLLAINRGDADIFIHNVFSVEYYQRKLNLKRPKIVSTTPYSFPVSFSVNREWAPLIPILHKVVSGLSPREKRFIFDKWINIEVERRLDWEKIAYWGSAVAVLVMLVIGVILRWNTLLKTEVYERTKELEKSSQDLRGLARHMDKVREEEKTMLAREIHDELGHALTALLMCVRQLGHLLKKNHTEKTPATVAIDLQLDEVESLVRQATDTSRRIMSELRPSVLEDLGLLAAIEWLVHEFESHYGISCRIRAADVPLNLSDQATTALFRIVQESLTNIGKHAYATHVEVIMACGSDCLTLQVIDNGRGLGAGWEGKEGSYGLQGMRERVLVFSGELSLSDGPTSGVILRVQIPLGS